MKERSGQIPPLSPAALHILLALADEDRDGYGIMREIARQPRRRFSSGLGTLCGQSSKFLDQGIVVRALPTESRT
jgi:hypothetical protein